MSLFINHNYFYIAAAREFGLQTHLWVEIIMLGNHGLPIRANPIYNNYPNNFVPPPAVVPPVNPPVLQPVLGVYKFLSRSECDNAIAELRDGIFFSQLSTMLI